MRWIPLLLLLACTADTKGVDSVADASLDAHDPSPMDPARLKDRDGDGVLSGKDCNDYNAAIYPDAEEICDDLDNDCDSLLNEGVFVDLDDDGWGVESWGQLCEPGTNTAADRGQEDCDDLDGGICPSCAESCDGVDNDCDGEVDEVFHLDADGDRYGTAETVICTTELPTVMNGDDCDDNDPNAYPYAEEVCDGADNDCDGRDDEGLYFDGDGDGFGEADAPCSEDGPNVSRDTDCDDTDPTVYPSAPEICDGRDQNCEGVVDNGYPDGDGDGVGDADRICTEGEALVRDAGDCDDDDATVYPTAPEICDDQDNDCDVAVDELPAFEDLDGDGWGGARRGAGCSASVSYEDQGGDCDDTSAAVYPGADEICDGLDNDCDGEGDEELAWTDADGDGYGETERTGDCDPTVTYAAVGDDCDEADPSVHPYACDDCDGLDNDCDGSVDEADADGETKGYIDLDQDGYGDETRWAYGCHNAYQWALEGGDCDDDAAHLNPDMTEICQDGVDNDCDGLLDCEDDDCGEADCSETDCDDGVDGDQDGYLDCQDDDCWGSDCGYAVATVTGGQIRGTLTREVEYDSSGNRRSTTEMAFSGSVTGRLVAHSASGVAIATCDWRVAQVRLIATDRHRVSVFSTGADCDTYGYTSWRGSCANWYQYNGWGCGSIRERNTTDRSVAALARESVSVEAGCGVSGDDFLPRTLVLVEGEGWRTADGAPWYGGAWSTTATRSVGSTSDFRTERTETDDVLLLLSEASSFVGPLDP